jgi:GT2 family glycosyltransferase
VVRVDAAVVIPAYDEPDHIVRALNGLEGQTDELLVVAADDATAAAAQNHPATDRVLEGPGEGPGTARNRGAGAVDAEVVCFTDADTVVPPGWVARHRSHYHDPSVVGVGGPLCPLDGSLRDAVLFRLFSDYWYRLTWPLGFVQASTNNCSYRREPFLRAGGFDESLSFIEDTDASLRMARRGRMVYDRHIAARTSVRRQTEEGYLGVFLTYLLGYVRYALGYDPGGSDYFREW